MMTTEDVYRMAQDMELDRCAHGLTLAILLGALSKPFGADLVAEVNAGRMSFDEVILALYFAVWAAPDIF
jgi:hypothetical protein